MWTFEFILERHGTDVFVFSNLRGYYLWTTDLERAFQSVIPLVQHVVWKNEQLCCIPQSDLNIEEFVMKGRTNLNFIKTQTLQPPQLHLEGDWWTYPDGTFFFFPKQGESVPARLVEKIKSDLGRRAV